VPIAKQGGKPVKDNNIQNGSPFHVGELQVQSRLGVADKIGAFAAKVIRDHMPDEHRRFYNQLPFLLLGAVDELGRPWASMLTGRPGFVTSPDARTLHINAKPLFGDPLAGALKAGRDVGILGIELETRRRNRMNGTIGAVTADGVAIQTRQSFGNCPQYIQTRATEILPSIDEVSPTRPIARADHFDAQSQAIIARADTLFAASGYSARSGAASDGADVSHRGGKPGFVQIEDARSFVFPDFSGNNHFNTVGNLVLNPKAGFLFPDFATGDVVYMTGTAEIIWEGDQVSAFAGAERLIRFKAEEVIRVEGTLPFRFDFKEFSPTLDSTGSWVQTRDTIAAGQENNIYDTLEVVVINNESEEIKSFHLQRVDGKPLADYQPGQFLTVRLTMPDQHAPVARIYTLSDAPNGEHFRLSIKRECTDGAVSNYMHDHVQRGFRLEAMAPRGKFVLDQSSDRSVVLISAGVGVTPMIAMLNYLVAEGERTQKFRPVHFIHGARNGRSVAFADHVRELAAAHDGLTVHIRLSQPDENDVLNQTHDSEGRIELELLKTVLPFDDHDFYLCGPNAFMQDVHDGLTSVGVRVDRIHYESFGPATVLQRVTAKSPHQSASETASGPVKVAFGTSGIESQWLPDKGTLLDLAEAAGLNPAFSCRSGVCGTCATRVLCGAIDYIEEPGHPVADNEVLICCASPRSASSEAGCGEDVGVVLDL
jgi:uncharacterized protein